MDIGASNWSETDASNNTPAPDGAPEGMFPSGGTMPLRAVMGATKRWWYDWPIPKISGGMSTVGECSPTAWPPVPCSTAWFTWCSSTPPTAMPRR